MILLLLFLVAFMTCGLRVFATKTTLRHLSLSFTSSLRVSIPNSFRSSSTESIRIFLGLPRGLFPSGYHSITDLTILFSLLLLMCPSHCSLCPVIQLVTGATPIISCISLLYLLPQLSVAVS